jgi:outer membrane protein OmpA-like peptidoglycan-associated protein
MKLRIFTFLFCACAAWSAAAQSAAPSAEQMIEQLRAPARTRSLRNLSVEAAPGQPTTVTAPAKRPSLSLLIQFDYNSARVRPESQQALANLVQALQSSELVGSRFAVEGHTDAKGGADYNLRLSEQRANAVRDFLRSRGVDEDRLFAFGKGASELANSSDPWAAENRRVRIVNLN